MNETMLGNSYFVGNTSIKNLLFQSNIESISHAILLYGEKGLGKKTLSKYIAMRHMAYNHVKNTKLFLDTNDARMVMDGIHPDFIVLGEEASIKVDDVRSLHKEINIKPNQGENKVILLTDCDDMTVPAQNALLKILEEPNISTKFILTTSKKESLLETVLSRVQSHRVKPVTDIGAGAEYIKKNYIDFSLEEIKEALLNEKGNIGKTINVLLGNNTDEAEMVAKNVIIAMSEKSRYNIAKELSNISDRKLFLNVLGELLKLLDDILLAGIKKDPTHPYIDFAEKITEKQIIETTKAVSELREKWIFNPNLNLMASWLSIQLVPNGRYK